MREFPPALLEGHRTFRRRGFRPERFRALAEAGQSPLAMVIACCDSRAAPEMILAAGPGELFVLRSVAALVPDPRSAPDCDSTAAAVEFAVLGLRVPHVVVLGHSGCGGIRAMRGQGAPLAAADRVGGWTGPFARALPPDAAAGHPDPQTALEQAAVRQSLAHLAGYPCLAAEAGPALHGAWFDIAAGQLHVLDHASGAFAPAT